MNIDQAKAIPLAQILETIGCKPAVTRKNEAMYLSPLRNEKTASFSVNHAKNCWYDFGTGTGGSVIEFVCAYLEASRESCTVYDALRWLHNMTGDVPVIRAVPATVFSKSESALALKHVQPLKHRALVGYLEGRGIPLKLASSYIVQVLVHNKGNGKDFFALGFANEEGGHEIRNKFFKGCLGTKFITFIRGKQAKPDGIHVFEGFLDYVSAIAYRNLTQFEDDAIVLNSLSCLKQATPYIKGYGYKMAYTWLDNDEAGHRGTKALAEFFRTEQDLRHRPMNAVYRPHKDVNAWHMNKLSLSL